MNLCNVFPKGSTIILLSIVQKNFKDLFFPDIVAHVFNLSTWEIEACGALRTCGQPNLHKEFWTGRTTKETLSHIDIYMYNIYTNVQMCLSVCKGHKVALDPLELENYI